MNRKFINKSNFVLRKILNSQENIDILKEFIEEILAIKIEEATINPYLIKKSWNKLYNLLKYKLKKRTCQ